MVTRDGFLLAEKVLYALRYHQYDGFLFSYFCANSAGFLIVCFLIIDKSPVLYGGGGFPQAHRVDLLFAIMGTYLAQVAMVTGSSSCCSIQTRIQQWSLFSAHIPR